ncbi:hypothetical protein B0J14DRAFT_259026 [Halenospora varia]|nr:hypothetical protein B0J14DRAFT_259026 [Halenospora varia]
MAQEKANLARIRDNQRRSRARRKEYLQHLEARLRQCELHGIEASSAIQVAARKVVDENKKLRSLLAQHGVGDDSVEAYLQCSLVSDASMEGRFGSCSDNVQELEQLLQTRKSYVSTVQSTWDLPTTGRRLSGTIQPTGKATSSSQQSMTSSTSTASRTSSVSLGHSSSCGISYHERLDSMQMPRNLSPPSSSSGNSNIFQFDPRLSLSNGSSYNSSLYPNISRKPPRHQISSLYTPNNTSSSNVDSCIFASGVTGTMAGGDPSAVRADLGFMSEMDCEADHRLDFNVMD